jgi:hypothetical protein
MFAADLQKRAVGRFMPDPSGHHSQKEYARRKRWVQDDAPLCLHRSKQRFTPNQQNIEHTACWGGVQI